MTELGEVNAQAVVAKGNGWSVGHAPGKFAGGFDVRIDKAAGDGFFSTVAFAPATDVEREAAKDRLVDAATDDVELDRIEAAFAAPWVQA